MAKDEMIDFDTVVRLLGVTKTSLEVYKSTLPDFPDGVGKKGCAKFYSRKAIMKWRKTHDIRALIRELARAKYRRRVQPIATAVANPQLDFHLAQQFLRGDFAGPSERQKIEMKKLVARNCRRQPMQRITVRPDWMYE